VHSTDRLPVPQVVRGYRLVLDPGSTTAVDGLGYPDFAGAPTERSGLTSLGRPSRIRRAHPAAAPNTAGPRLVTPNAILRWYPRLVRTGGTQSCN